jgi:hypothetical protein
MTKAGEKIKLILDQAVIMQPSRRRVMTVAGGTVPGAIGGRRQNLAAYAADAA